MPRKMSRLSPVKMARLGTLQAAITVPPPENRAIKADRYSMPSLIGWSMGRASLQWGQLPLATVLPEYSNQSFPLLFTVIPAQRESRTAPPLQPQNVFQAYHQARLFYNFPEAADYPRHIAVPGQGVVAQG